MGLVSQIGKLPNPNNDCTHTDDLTGAVSYLFELRGVSLIEEGRRIVDHVTVDLVAGGITCLVGPSGSGKSSLLRLLNRLDVPSEGTISYRGESLDGLDPLILRKEVAMVFQRPPLFPGTTTDNLRWAAPGLTENQEREALSRVNLDLDPSQDVDTISGGEAQRLCLARALLTEPDVILADEPTSSLDQHATADIEKVLTNLARDGLSVILVSHDVAQMERLADRVAVMSDGRVVAYDELKLVQESNDPTVLRSIRSVAR